MSYYSICTKVSPYCPVEATTYGYYPNLGGNIFFAAFFGALCAIQLGIGIYFRTWTFLVALVIGAAMELVGYIGRIQMHSNPWSSGPFKTQIVCLILAPTFIAAGVYLTLKHIILALGEEHSRLKPRLFTWIFIGCDIGSLVLQAAGGGIAAAAGSTDAHLLDIGDNVIIVGIVFQVATMSICGLLGLEFFVRVLRQRNGWSGLLEKPVESSMSGTGTNTGTRNGWMGDIRLVCAAEVFAYFTVLIRCIYRLVPRPPFPSDGIYTWCRSTSTCTYYLRDNIY